MWMRWRWGGRTMLMLWPEATEMLWRAAVSTGVALNALMVCAAAPAFKMCDERLNYLDNGDLWGTRQNQDPNVEHFHDGSPGVAHKRSKNVKDQRCELRLVLRLLLLQEASYPAGLQITQDLPVLTLPWQRETHEELIICFTPPSCWGNGWRRKEEVCSQVSYPLSTLFMTAVGLSRDTTKDK